MSALETFRYHVADEAGTGDVEGRSPESFGAEVPGGPDPATALSFTSDEAAARYYLDELLRQDERPALRSVVEPELPERVPGLVVEGEQDLRPLGTRQVRFAQTHRTIPVFGASAVVELTSARDLVSVNAQLDAVTGVDAVESLTRADAVRRVEEYTGTTIAAEAAVAGRLTFYKDEEAQAWHLAWLLPGLPAAPPVSADETPGERSGHGLGRRPVPPSVTYLVDAHDGTILFHFSAVPTAGPVPARCTGIDETETQQTFLGELAAAGGTRCRLADARRSIRTYDLRFSDIDSNPPVPEPPVEAETSDYGTVNRAAVSAHVNATRVYDFYKLVLQRNGIDDQGMVLVSQVNTTAASMQAPPSLLNAFWWDKKMWYGQVMRAGRLVSLSQYLDVIAHELTHGVIETTSNLVYATQSGALNESFADVAGVIINNWYTAPDPKDVATWNWEIGSGLDRGNRPLRDFANPARLGDPEHMDDFRRLRPGERPNDLNDQGWVHVNSNIHNKAVHNLLTTSRNGQRVFTVEDVALLTYLGMTRLTQLATFTDALQAVVDVAQSYFGGDRNRQVKIDAIRDAYGRAGIG
ncbi:M4 family metallopeptidase [Pseudonocardia sp. DSM 110487]|uniref:M4 family metallopeptidase n=1 Tax=Pseudonocardia sp. DSM 110487 TaxID=2865833 RepID=UPI001C6A7236|nr:M4 family metallopeptidase [Pseudonocardia sp. DSM 110487]QYN39140.1 M4 family metallopeptidase [Pseudonocardia sp. DSM 110487]